METLLSPPCLLNRRGAVDHLTWCLFDHLLHLYLQTTTFQSKSIQQRTISFLSKTIQLKPRTIVSFHRFPRAVECVVNGNFTSPKRARGSHI